MGSGPSVRCGVLSIRGLRTTTTVLASWKRPCRPWPDCKCRHEVSARSMLRRNTGHSSVHGTDATRAAPGVLCSVDNGRLCDEMSVRGRLYVKHFAWGSSKQRCNFVADHTTRTLTSPRFGMTASRRSARSTGTRAFARSPGARRERLSDRFRASFAIVTCTDAPPRACRRVLRGRVNAASCPGANLDDGAGIGHFGRERPAHSGGVHWGAAGVTGAGACAPRTAGQC